MEGVLTIYAPALKINHCNNRNNRTISFSKTLITKLSFNFLKPKTITATSICSSFHQSSSSSSLSPPLPVKEDSTNHTTLLVESYHEHRRLKALLDRLDKKGSCPLRVLNEDGDWSKDQFWAVIRFLKHSSRFDEILPVFDLWKNIENSRIRELNYEKIVKLLSEEGMMDKAISALQEMKSHDLTPTLDLYNSIIHGYAKIGKFDDSMLYLNQMKEDNLFPETHTYDGLIESYGKFKSYDGIVTCLKKMELDGCSPDHVTYNLLIKEFSRGGLLQRMESVYQKLMSKKMTLESSSLVAMLEAYANFRIVEKMEKIYGKVLNFGIALEEDLIRKLADIYLDNYMFSRLDDLGHDMFLRNDVKDLCWCLRLLSHACHLSRKGMDSIIWEMEEDNVSWNVTIVNIICLAYLKMEDFKHLRILFSQIPVRRVKPDVITIGILFDAIRIGFDGCGALDSWRRLGFLDESVEMNTDPLVLTAFGKGRFLKSSEAVYSSMDPKARERVIWTYHNLIDLVVKHKGWESRENGVE